MSTPSSIGILAYGSLLTDPGEEIKPHIIKRIPVRTPFEIEYARSSIGRSGAPTLVPVPDGKGSKVDAQILVLINDVSIETARNFLYRREINKVLNTDKIYVDEKQRASGNSVAIETLENFFCISDVIYTSLKPNIREILKDDLSDKEKAQILAGLAINSLNKETYETRRDGIQYLQDNIEKGIITKLTNIYRQVILKKSGGKDLSSARRILMKER